MEEAAKRKNRCTPVGEAVSASRQVERPFLIMVLSGWVRLCLHSTALVSLLGCIVSVESAIVVVLDATLLEATT